MVVFFCKCSVTQIGVALRSQYIIELLFPVNEFVTPRETGV